MGTCVFVFKQSAKRGHDIESGLLPPLIFMNSLSQTLVRGIIGLFPVHNWSLVHNSSLHMRLELAMEVKCIGGCECVHTLVYVVATIANLLLFLDE